ncbi:MAG: amidohydrolase [Oscillospiraceae bacterium]|nr:amidohydrolase [Oscillospiraceae bacterium]
MLLIKNGHIKTMAGAELEGGAVLIGDDGKILKVGMNLPAPEGCAVIDAEGRLVTPGLVEAHCHIGLHNEAVGWEGMDYNEGIDPITPQMRAIDSIYPMDESFELARKGGVTTCCTGPGSANVLGGTFVAIKTAGKRVDDMVVKYPIAMKCAFGENPKRFYGKQSKKAPLTRMGTAALLRETLFKAKAYMEEKDAGKEPKFDMKLEAMLPVMRGEIPLKAHAHRSDDIFTSIRIAKEFGVGLTLDHCTDGAVIAEELAQEGYPAFVGPSLGSKTKIELQSKSFDAPGILHKAGVKVSIITDAPVIPQQYLSMCAGQAVQAGLPMEEGWKAVTINPAESIGIADRVGSLEPGKDGDVVIWTADPLVNVGARAVCTVIEGRVVYQEA